MMRVMSGVLYSRARARARVRAGAPAACSGERGEWRGRPRSLAGPHGHRQQVRAVGAGVAAVLRVARLPVRHLAL